MEQYTLLRQFADSWMLLALFAFFVGVILWVFRPGANAIHRDTADIPFRNTDAPTPRRGDAKPATKEARQ